MAVVNAPDHLPPGAVQRRIRRDPRLLILGCRGVPARHGGFETFAAYLAPYLASRGWDVEIACQEEGSGPLAFDRWRGVTRVRIPVCGSGSLSTIAFDWRSIRYALAVRRPVLLLGYNTAVLAAALRLRGIPVVINMDGLEWKRAKWPLPIKAWFWVMERLACHIGSELIADHPEIARHLATRVSARKIATVGYCADAVVACDDGAVRALSLVPGRYAVLIARAEPENSVLEIVAAHRLSGTADKLAILGDYQPGRPYHDAVCQAAGPGAVFLGAIYDSHIVQALRWHARFYVHGHRVGGTNPSLVEALAAGCPVLAHDNEFNRWVAGPGMLYFRSVEECALQFARLERDVELVERLRAWAVTRHAEAFTPAHILSDYETLLQRWSSVRHGSRAPRGLPSEHGPIMPQAD